MLSTADTLKLLDLFESSAMEFFLQKKPEATLADLALFYRKRVTEIGLDRTINLDPNKTLEMTMANFCFGSPLAEKPFNESWMRSIRRVVKCLKDDLEKPLNRK